MGSAPYAAFSRVVNLQTFRVKNTRFTSEGIWKSENHSFWVFLFALKSQRGCGRAKITLLWVFFFSL